MLSKKSGIYEIVNTINGKRYVGSTASLQYRKCRHWWSLRKGRHHNIHLQRAWCKYGEDAFGFSVLEYWEPEFLMSFEQWWINMLCPEYNMCRVAGSCLGIKRTAEQNARNSASKKLVMRSTKHRAQISKALKGRTFTDEHRSNMSEGRIGMKFTDEHKANVSAAMKRSWARRKKENDDE